MIDLETWERITLNNSWKKEKIENFVLTNNFSYNNK